MYVFGNMYYMACMCDHLVGVHSLSLWVPDL